MNMEMERGKKNMFFGVLEKITNLLLNVSDQKYSQYNSVQSALWQQLNR